MAIDRSTIIVGPGKITHDGATYFSDVDITVQVEKRYFDIRTDAFGLVARALTDVSMQISATPKEWANHAKMNPYASMALGTLINGGTDKPLVITPVNGEPQTFAAAAVLQPPQLVLSADKAPIGSMTWTAVLANGSEWSAAGARVAHGSSATGVALTGFTKANAALCTWSPAYGATNIKTEAGIVVDFAIQLDEQRTDSDGIVDYSLGDVQASARFVPVGMSASDFVTLLAIQGAGITRGATAAVADLVVTGSLGARAFTLKNCSPRTGQARYGKSVKRIGEVELVSTRSETSGALDPLWVIA